MGGWEERNRHRLPRRSQIVMTNLKLMGGEQALLPHFLTCGKQCYFTSFQTSNTSSLGVTSGTDLSNPGEGKQSCPKCNFSTVDKRRYQKHLAKHANGNQLEGSLATLKCSQCSFTTAYKAQFKRHQTNMSHFAR